MNRRDVIACVVRLTSSARQNDHASDNYQSISYTPYIDSEKEKEKGRREQHYIRFTIITVRAICNQSLLLLID